MNTENGTRRPKSFTVRSSCETVSNHVACAPRLPTAMSTYLSPLPPAQLVSSSHLNCEPPRDLNLGAQKLGAIPEVLDPMLDLFHDGQLLLVLALVSQHFLVGGRLLSGDDGRFTVRSY